MQRGVHLKRSMVLKLRSISTTWQKYSKKTHGMVTAGWEATINRRVEARQRLQVSIPVINKG